MRSKLMFVVVSGLALATAACGGSEPAQEAGDAVEPAPAETTVVAAAVDAKPASFAQCAVCHVTEADKASTLGPNLFGIVGRTAGTVEGFNYSPGMRDAGLTWEASNLDAFITAPQKVVPGTQMAFGGVADAAKRKEIVDYLTSLK